MKGSSKEDAYRLKKSDALKLGAASACQQTVLSMKRFEIE